ncbi:MAG: ASKHA domain-containing protein [Eubacteriales bacterium]|nr:ASKHA domain-containing protein [Eubacteriales bacterium]
MITIISNDNKLNIDFDGEITLHKLLADNGFTINAPCGGKGTCGKCAINVDGEILLACETFARDGMVVTIDSEANAEILADVESMNTTHKEQGYGVALDLGTTTIAACLYDLYDGKKIKTIAQINRQKAYGGDVISRSEHSEKMHEIIIQQMNDIIDEFGVQVKMLCIAGNTIMQHFVLGLDARPITVAPFTPQITEMVSTSGKKLGINAEAVVLMPCISGYVGGDIVAGILATGLYMSEKPCILLDIGTNGEIVIGSKDGIYCCSAAAGPAFEGANISCGMSGVNGAVSKVSIDDGVISYETIGEKAPVGICGSGILDAVAEFIKSDIIDETGYLEDDVKICDNVTITPKDIREVQLAKAAICAGINVLLKKTGISTNDIDKLYLAGGFGNYLDKKSAGEIGLFPKELLPKVETVGNTSLKGVSMALLDDNNRLLTTEIQHNAKYIELSCDLDFQSEYVEQMMF